MTNASIEHGSMRAPDTPETTTRGPSLSPTTSKERHYIDTVTAQIQLKDRCIRALPSS